jgi:hypothetical protein
MLAAIGRVLDCILPRDAPINKASKQCITFESAPGARVGPEICASTDVPRADVAVSASGEVDNCSSREALHHSWLPYAASSARTLERAGDFRIHENGANIRATHPVTVAYSYSGNEAIAEAVAVATLVNAPIVRGSGGFIDLEKASWPSLPLTSPSPATPRTKSANARLDQCNGNLLAFLSENGVSDEAVMKLASVGLGSLPKLIKAQKEGLRRAGLKMGPRSKVLSLLRTLFLPGEDPAVAEMLEEAGLGACRVGCAEQEVDLAALAELGREWKATMDDGGSPLFDDLQALDIAPWTLEAAAFRDLAVAVGIKSAKKKH